MAERLLSALRSLATDLKSGQDAEIIYEHNVQLAEIGSLLSQNDEDAMSLRRQISSQPNSAQDLLEAWKTISSRLQKEDNDNRSVREAAAFAALNKVTAPANSQSEPAEGPTVSPVTMQIYQTIVQLARVTRDMLAGLAKAKAIVLPCEPFMRSIIYRITTFDRIKDEEMIPAQRAIIQALSNLVSPVDDDTAEWVFPLWQMYNTGSREDAIMLRALDSDDAMTIMSCIMLTINFVRADDKVTKSLGTSELRPLVAKMIHKIGAYSEAEGGTMEERCFHLGYQLFSMLFQNDMQSLLFSILSDPNEPVTPSQTTLLQLLDGYHHNADWDAGTSTPSQRNGYSFLIPTFFTMADYAIAAMTPSIARTEQDQQTLDDDPKLPKVFEACILVCQCMITVCLAETEHAAQTAKGLLSAIRTAREGDKHFISVLIGESASITQGKTTAKLIHLPALDLLRTTESFIPRVKPFRPNDASSTESSDGANGLAGFAPLKRDLVQLAGLLANDDKAIQDQIRECGGMQVILSMCVTDDRNPRKYICRHTVLRSRSERLTSVQPASPVIREYALLAVRNLMIDNEANQAIIKEMDPVGMVGPDGELREMPARMGVKK
ncbi:hypothetical protein QFC22_000642 [Naganishia vaughanmartiniae]|uniref:Uncharacterized protein n=1 Tax=Naganishia vaughanmartiniae TaxID=1424756 RepID=A0ACC2XNR7_9TREE|nr:hypothetical protein QFC22_000642 [Naganishia vaughanmartiniae]